MIGTKMAYMFAILSTIVVVMAAPDTMADNTTYVVTLAPDSSDYGCEQTDECFLPHTVTIDVGDTVTWSNSDTTSHTVTSGTPEVGIDGTFDSSLLAPGDEFSHTFTAAGEHPYFCILYPWMSGMVIVQDASSAETDDNATMIFDKISGMMMLSDGTEVGIKTTQPVADESMTIDITFKEREHTNYDIKAMQGYTVVLDVMGSHDHTGMGVHMTDSLASNEPVDITVTFQGYGVKDITGPQNEKLVFAQIVTEFGTIAILNVTDYVTNPSWPNIHANVLTSFNSDVESPTIEPHAFIHPFAVVIGDCYIGKWVLVAPTAVCRGDEGAPIHVGDGSNMQDGVVMHALETVDDGHNIDDRRFSVDGDRLKGDDYRFADGYAIYVGNNTSLAHGSLIHGPAWIGHNTFIGMEALVFNAKIGNNVAVGVAAVVTGGVEIADGRFVPPGAVIVTQELADALPERVGSAYENTNYAVINVNQQLAEGYDMLDLERLALEREKEMEERMLETAMPHP